MVKLCFKIKINALQYDIKLSLKNILDCAMHRVSFYFM